MCVRGCAQSFYMMVRNIYMCVCARTHYASINLTLAIKLTLGIKLQN